MNKNEIIKKDEASTMLIDIQNTKKMCEALLQSAHYKKIGTEGIYAIVEKAKSIGVSPLDALNGGMYFVQGKVELTASMMNQLIRQGGHSITKDKRSDNSVCILHGKRKDNCDTWTESFSIEDAKLAGIYRNQWLKYPKDMLFARALSRLARQLFPDVIKGCYVQGEISEAILVEEVKEMPLKLSDDQLSELTLALGENADLKEKLINFIKSEGMGDDLQDLNPKYFVKMLEKCYAENSKSEKVAE